MVDHVPSEHLKDRQNWWQRESFSSKLWHSATYILAIPVYAFTILLAICIDERSIVRDAVDFAVYGLMLCLTIRLSWLAGQLFQQTKGAIYIPYVSLQVLDRAYANSLLICGLAQIYLLAVSIEENAILFGLACLTTLLSLIAWIESRFNDLNPT